MKHPAICLKFEVKPFSVGLPVRILLCGQTVDLCVIIEFELKSRREMRALPHAESLGRL